MDIGTKANYSASPRTTHSSNGDAIDLPLVRQIVLPKPACHRMCVAGINPHLGQPDWQQLDDDVADQGVNELGTTVTEL